MSGFRKAVYALWIVSVLGLLIAFLVSPSSFTPESVARIVSEYGSHIFVAYTVACIVRGLFLIPSTPFVLAGIIIFPDQPWAVLLISMIGIVVGSTAVYYFSDFLGFSSKLEKRFPKQIERWHGRLNSPWATLIVLGWSFFPLVPTDVICYVAGIVKMQYKYLILGVVAGEFILIYIYVFYGIGIMDYFFG